MDWINRIHQGDVLEILRQMPSDFVDCILTSPPYWRLRRYLPETHQLSHKEIGMEATFQEHIVKILEITMEIKRVLRPTGSFWLNYGDSWASNGSERFDTKKYGGKETIRSGRARTNEFRAKSMIGIPWRIALAMLDQQNWILRQDIKWLKQVYHVKENYTIGTVTPASVTDRFNNSGEYLFHFVKEPHYYFNLDEVRIPKQVEGVTDLRDGAFNRMRDKGYNIKYPYSSHLPKKYGNDNVDKHHSHKRFSSGTPREWHEKGKNIPTAWLISPEPGHEDHFAKFPIRLVTIPILTTCPENGVVLDPFSGSGTTCHVAQSLKRNWIGIELNPEYVKLTESKLRQDVMI